ncbi:YbhB/YbcL family Raf kinase inhibitor-like protein [Streptomyces sp. PTM05]|uniref:YbhB/YbcL family Raf kinase inhibitor-like protein n=1 Tax=Streptantibioticus parmotrematis TaxID=2873249 RepID=A0ABS7QS79_9ACTN|nr:YbhB/YbcL family Raf kinase inhibitor-like protein [Streptantibioticus parmotrematis]MBY8886041.1 YbhB/YbcL family Raf kinase inhibitor-like protein [Streptantibioticus parmotrematis]
MTPLGRLLRNRRAGDTHLAWNLPNFQCVPSNSGVGVSHSSDSGGDPAGSRGPTSLGLTSRDFGDGDAIPLAHCAKNIGGDDTSPHLAWTPPPGTAQLLLVVEDIDVPLPKPAVHCAALIDPATAHLGPGALDAPHPANGVRLLRSTIGRGYHGPAPIKGHGPHRYVFQLFALAAPVNDPLGTTALERARPRVFLPAITAPVLARARLTGVYER